jgi:hypothetical protein
MISKRDDPVELRPYLYGWLDEFPEDTRKCAWDIGCSKGNTMMELMYRFKEVVGFDPSTVAIDYLKRVPPVKGIRVLDLAISNYDGKVELDLEEGHRRVSCRSLDSLTRNLTVPDFIKVDVDGHEYQVLLGAEFIMITQAPKWLIEVYSAESGRKCQAVLYKYGYNCTLVLHPDDPDPMNHYWIRAHIPE